MDSATVSGRPESLMTRMPAFLFPGVTTLALVGLALKGPWGATDGPRAGPPKRRLGLLALESAFLLAALLGLWIRAFGGIETRFLGIPLVARGPSRAFLVAALLTEWHFMMAIREFLGVKLAHVLPVVLIGLLVAAAASPPGTL